MMMRRMMTRTDWMSWASMTTVLLLQVNIISSSRYAVSNLSNFAETELAVSERTTQQSKEVKDVKEVKQEPGPVTTSTTSSSSARPFDVSSLIKKEEADTDPETEEAVVTPPHNNNLGKPAPAPSPGQHPGAGLYPGYLGLYSQLLHSPLMMQVRQR